MSMGDVIIVPVFENPFDRPANQFLAGFQIKFTLDVFLVRLDGLDAQVQAAGEFAAGLSLTDKLEDLKLAIGKDIDDRVFSRIPRVVTPLENPFRHVLG